MLLCSKPTNQNILLYPKSRKFQIFCPWNSNLTSYKNPSNFITFPPSFHKWTIQIILHLKSVLYSNTYWSNRWGAWFLLKARSQVQIFGVQYRYGQTLGIRRTHQTPIYLSRARWTHSTATKTWFIKSNYTLFQSYKLSSLLSIRCNTKIEKIFYINDV